MSTLGKQFWEWYERHRTLNVSIAALLFAWQLVHLYWLSTDVVLFRIFGESFFSVSGAWQTLLVLVDYTEVPALVITSFVYISELRRSWNLKSVVYLIFLNSQWLHIFWITDEFVVEQFLTGARVPLLPAWLAWIAIGIDYLELPVIYDTIKQAGASLLKKFDNRA